MSPPLDRPGADPGVRITSLDELDRVDLDGIQWRPIRRRLHVTAFGINAYSGDLAGDELIEEHDETSPGSGGHEELYLVQRGHASFTVGGASVDAPAGTLILVPPGVRRSATAAAARTLIVVIGGRPGTALPVSPFEHWYAAQPAFQAGDDDRAVDVASAGLADWPGHGQIHYQLACFHARAGHAANALHHLRVAIANEPRAVGWANEDRDLDSIRGAPDWPAGAPT